MKGVLKEMALNLCFKESEKIAQIWMWETEIVIPGWGNSMSKDMDVWNISVY